MDILTRVAQLEAKINDELSALYTGLELQEEASERFHEMDKKEFAYWSHHLDLIKACMRQNDLHIRQMSKLYQHLERLAGGLR